MSVNDCVVIEEMIHFLPKYNKVVRPIIWSIFIGLNGKEK